MCPGIEKDKYMHLESNICQEKKHISPNSMQGNVVHNRD